MATDQFTIIGTLVDRVDGVDKVTGRAKITGDVTVPRMLIGKFLRSPYAHARILSISTSEAKRVPGGVTVLTAADLTDLNPYLRGKNRKDHLILAIDRALFAGQSVAAVAAVDELAAQEALGKIRIEYEGHSLFESIIYENGQIVNANLVDYRVPRFNDLLGEYESILVENADGPGPFGAKGMGEGGIISSFLLGRDEIVRDKHQMALQSCLCHGSITHLKCSYGLATQMSVTTTTSGLGQHVTWSFLSDRG